MEKPIEEWLSELPDGYRERALEILATYCGWKKRGDFWIAPTGGWFTQLSFTTDANLFLEAWNKAVEEFDSIEQGTVSQELQKTGYNIAYKLRHLPYCFTIETRLPVLLDIIEWLNQQKK